MTKLKVSRKRYRKVTDRFKNTIFVLEGRKDSTPVTQVLLDTKPQSPRSKHFLKRKEKNFIKRAAAQGAFRGFNKKTYFRALKKGKLPKGYVVSYMVPPRIGGSYDESNMIITMPEIAHFLDVFYWKQIAPFVNKERYYQQGHKVGVAFRTMPKVLTPNAFLDFVLPDEKNDFATRLNYRLHWRGKVQEKAAMEEGYDFVYFRLKRKQQPPKGMKNAILRVQPISMLERDAVRAEYHAKRPEMVMACLERGDFDKLSEDVRAYIVRSKGYVPTETQLTCHHIIPRALGGENTLDNIMWLPVNNHMELHEKYINPLYFCIEQMEDINKAVYVQMPIPENSTLQTYMKVGTQMVPYEEGVKRTTGSKKFAKIKKALLGAGR